MNKYISQYKEELPPIHITNSLLTLDKLDYKIIVNTNLFQEAGNMWRKYGYYTDAPINTPEYDAFWDEEERRCFEGYSVGGMWIPGTYYFYLNYTPIQRIPSRQYLQYHPRAEKTKKTLDLPSFWEIDLYWWYTKTLALWNSKNFIRDCHIACVKTRRGGFSFKEAVEGIYNYTFIPYSKSQYFAATESYLIKDGIFNKVEGVLDHIDTHTAWRKNRLVDTKFHYKAGWLEGQVAKGYMSELIAQVLDKPDKARGGDSRKISLEEAGSFPDILTAYQVLLPQVTQGGITTGFITAFGTGGNKDEKGIEGLQELFYNPSPYGIISFNNKWDADILDTECGFFVPATAVMEQYMDENGILNITAATNKCISERLHYEKAGDKQALAKHIAEQPLVPGEALVRSRTNVFDTAACRKQIMKLKAKVIYNPGQTGDLVIENDKLIWLPVDKKPLIDWPIQPGGGGLHSPIEGSIVIYQQPAKDDNKTVYKGLYFITVDPYAQDESEHSTSVGAVYVWKRTSNVSLDNFSDNIVASYIGRPKTTDAFWDTVFKLAKYYNCEATVQSEILGGGQLGINFARQHKLEKYLAYRFETLDPKEFKINVKGSKTYFTTVTKDMKEVGLELLKTWSNEIVTVVEGHTVSRIETIYDIGLLEEMLNFVTNDKNKNFDRISSALLMPFQKREMLNIQVKDTAKQLDKRTQFFTRKFY